MRGQPVRGPRRIARLVAVAAMVALIGIVPLAGSASANAQANKHLRIAFSVPGLNFPFFVHMMDLAKKHAADLGNIDFIPLDGGNAATKQTSDLEAMIAQKVDGIVISPIDVNAMQPAVQEVVSAHIPLVTVDRNVTGVATLAHVGADNVEGGRLQGQYLIQILPNGGNVYELRGQPGASPAIDRDKGLKEALQGHSSIKIVVDQTANFQKVDAVNVMESALAGNPTPDAIVCANDDMALGVVEVAKEQNLKAPIIGYDALPESLQAINAGTMAATIEQFPGQQASKALDILVDYLRNGKSPSQHDNYLTPKLITKANLMEAERVAEAGLAGAASPVASPTS